MMLPFSQNFALFFWSLASHQISLKIRCVFLLKCAWRPQLLLLLKACVVPCLASPQTDSWHLWIHAYTDIDPLCAGLHTALFIFKQSVIFNSPSSLCSHKFCIQWRFWRRFHCHKLWTNMLIIKNSPSTGQWWCILPWFLVSETVRRSD